ncbi:hypothetical protein VNO78_03133 [Psophocarpus tetragonolobus]|uniref:MADS-box domain-containing protein n=1 Tax=Psophocarpus tetragonolobus TaxID=3891 RepID=A0AAN9T032_PSOTE
MSEFSTACGVNACLIMYDDNGDTPLMTWPQDPNEVHSIITRYEGIKHEKLPKNFYLNNFLKDRKSMVEIEISKIQKEIIKIQYPTWQLSFNNLSIEELENFMARLDIKLEACNQRIRMSKHKPQNEANFNFMQSIVQPESVASNLSQLNFMQEIPHNQLILASMRPLNGGNQVASYLHNIDEGSSSQCQMPNFDPNLMQLMAENTGVVNTTNQVAVPMIPLNDGNHVACYQLNLDKVSSSQSQIPNFDPNLMQLMAKNKGVLHNQVDLPLNYANQIDAFGNSANQHNVSVNLINQLDESLEFFSQHEGIEELTSQLDEVVHWSSQPDESKNWTNQHGVPVIEGSTTANCGAISTTYDTRFQGVVESSLCNYNGVVQSMEPYNYDVALQNIAYQSGNVQQTVTLPPLPPSLDEFQTYHNNMVQNYLSNHIV